MEYSKLKEIIRQANTEYLQICPFASWLPSTTDDIIKRLSKPNTYPILTITECVAGFYVREDNTYTITFTVIYDTDEL